MKNIYIRIQVLGKNEIQFSSPLNEWAKHQLPDVSFSDFDNYSEGYYIDQIINMAEKADRVILEISAVETDVTGQVTRFFNRLSRNTGIRCLTLFDGKNNVLEKMAAMISQGNFYFNTGTTVAREAVTKFLNAPVK